jgi:hypothetical protein
VISFYFKIYCQLLLRGDCQQQIGHFFKVLVHLLAVDDNLFFARSEFHATKRQIRVNLYSWEIE